MANEPETAKQPAPAGSLEPTPLSLLERWVTFGEADGYLTLTSTDCGIVKLGCGKEVRVPGDFVNCQHTPPCECPQTGWIAEFEAHAVKENATYPGEHSEHVWAFGLTQDAACTALVAAIRERRVCECHGGSTPTIPERNATETPPQSRPRAEDAR